jgi:hypothetical protein
MVAGRFTYEDEAGTIQVRCENAIVETRMKCVPSTALNHATQSMMARMDSAHSVSPDRIRDFAVMSVSWLGQMTKDEFYDLSNDVEDPKH